MPKSAILAALVAFLPLAAQAKPNIILIHADDLGYAGLGCYGQKRILTPRIDRMAAEGMRFTDFYASSAACVPSRVGLLLGMHAGQAPIRDNLLPHLPDFNGYMERMPEALWPPTQPTLGRVMKDAGYHTAQFGKLEAGIPMQPGKMAAHGWDHWFGFKGTGAAFQFYPLELWKNETRVEYPENRPADVRRPGQITATPAAAWDFMATFAELAGVAAPAHHTGVSILPTLLGTPDLQQPREYLYWEYHQGKQQAIRIGPWKGIRIGGTREPIELYNLDQDIGETRNLAAEHPDIVARIATLMEQARAGSEFNPFWPLPEHRLNRIGPDKHIYDRVANGIR